MYAAPIIRVDSVDSTMGELAALVAAGPVAPWTAVIADFQRKGRGRADRSWEASPGSALLATIYAPIAIDPARVGMLAIAAGLAVVDAIAPLGVNARLKWPNDILVNERKLAGVLISTRLGSTVEASVGIGLNVTEAPRLAIALAELVPHPPPAIALLEVIRGAMIELWSALEVGQFAPVSARWNEVAVWTGLTVSMPGGQDIAGRLIGVDDWGQLRVETDGGEVRLAENEIVRGPVPEGAASYNSLSSAPAPNPSGLPGITS